MAIPLARSSPATSVWKPSPEVLAVLSVPRRSAPQRDLLHRAGACSQAPLVEEVGEVAVQRHGDWPILRRGQRDRLADRLHALAAEAAVTAAAAVLRVAVEAGRAALGVDPG